MSVRACPALPRSLKREHVATKATQCLNDGERKVLIGEEAHDGALSGFVVLNLGVDLVPMRTDVRPRVGQILGPEAGVRAQEFRFACARSTGLFESQTDSRARDAGVAMTRIGQVDAGLRQRSRATSCSIGLLAPVLGYESLCLFAGLSGKLA